MNLLLEAIERHARERPNVGAIAADDGAWTSWSELAREASCLRAAIVSRTSIDTRVAISLPSGRDFWVACLAAAGSGRLVVLLPCPTPGIVESRLATHLGADHLRIDERTIRDLRAARAPAAAVQASGGVTLLSSGTTGQSRFVVRSGEMVDSIARTLVDEELCLEDDLVASFLPMSHAYGFEHALLGPILAGAPVRALKSFNVERASAALESGATVLPTIPVAAAAIADAAPAAPRLRLAVSAGSLLPHAVREAFEERVGRIVDLYGASEVGTIWLDRGDGGRPVAGVEVRLQRSPQCPTGADGEILVGGRNLPLGSLDENGAVQPITSDGWFHTGDLGKRIGAGGYCIVGRSKLVFDVGGLKVNPLEIEEVLERHPAVRRALVHPIAAGPALHRVGVKVELRSGSAAPTLDQIREHLSPHIALHASPRSLIIVDCLPKTASGKLLREDPSQGSHASATSAPTPIPPVVRRPRGLEARGDRERYTKQLFDETARGYDNSSGAAFLRTGRWYRRRMLLNAGVRPGSHHLDVGSGTGLCAWLAQDIVGPEGRVVALDPSTGMLEVAKRRGVRETIEGRAEHLPFPDASFDSVSMSYMLRHIEDLMLAFREAVRVLRPGGKIVIFEVTRPETIGLRESFDVAMRWVVPAVGVVASGKPSTFPMMQYWADTVRDAARPPRIVEALERSGFVGTRHLLELGVFSCYRGVAPLSHR